MYTTLNIQHIESLNEILKKITNIKVKEVVPDKYVRMADNIELIDIEPEELINRIEDGKVYKKDRIERAKENFFTIENLTKLREIALRYMMDSVERKNILNTEEHLVLVLDEEEQEILNRIVDLADYLHCDWCVILLGKMRNSPWREKIRQLGGRVEEVDKEKFREKIKEKEYTKILVTKNFFLKRFLKFFWWMKKEKDLDFYILKEGERG